jgi:hypothetical protein
LRRGLKDSNCGSLTGERSGAWRRAPLQRCLGETPFRGALELRRPPKIRKREPDAWAAETDGTRECERGGRYGRPFFFLQALRLAIARAMRRPIVISEATDWTPIVSFARLLSGIVSVGL